jgi:thiol-disulfide isomerase/thioredoxin
VVRASTCAAALLLAAAAARAAEPRPFAPPPPAVIPADLDAVLAAVRAPGARAVLVNVWATWCDPCREELPGLLRFYRERRAQGLRLVLVSADDEQNRDKVARFLAGQGVDFPSWLKRGDDQVFINGLDRRWTGALPASFLYDGEGHLQKFWPGEVTPETLARALAEIPTQHSKTKDTSPKTRREP